MQYVTEWDVCKCLSHQTQSIFINMQQHQHKQPIRQTELSIKADLSDASCGGALGNIVVQLVTMVMRPQQLSRWWFWGLNAIGKNSKELPVVQQAQKNGIVFVSHGQGWTCGRLK